MIERNIKKLLLEALNETGDDPEEVTCDYFRQLLPNIEQKNERCSAADLPAGELSTLSCFSKKHVYTLVSTAKEIKIETSLNTDPS